MLVKHAEESRFLFPAMQKQNKTPKVCLIAAKGRGSMGTNFEER